MTTYTAGQSIWLDNQTPATVVHDAAGPTVLVTTGNGIGDVRRERITPQGTCNLARNEQQPTPANRHYFGLRAGGVLKRRGR